MILKYVFLLNRKRPNEGSMTNIVMTAKRSTKRANENQRSKTTPDSWSCRPTKERQTAMSTKESTRYRRKTMRTLTTGTTSLRRETRILTWTKWSKNIKTGRLLNKNKTKR